MGSEMCIRDRVTSAWGAATVAVFCAALCAELVVETVVVSTATVWPIATTVVDRTIDKEKRVTILYFIAIMITK